MANSKKSLKIWCSMADICLRCRHMSALLHQSFLKKKYFFSRNPILRALAAVFVVHCTATGICARDVTDSSKYIVSQTDLSSVDQVSTCEIKESNKNQYLKTVQWVVKSQTGHLETYLLNVKIADHWRFVILFLFFFFPRCFYLFFFYFECS